VNILDFNKDILWRKPDTGIVDFIRNEKKFESIDALVEEIKNDEKVTRKTIGVSGL